MKYGSRICIEKYTIINIIIINIIIINIIIINIITINIITINIIIISIIIIICTSTFQSVCHLNPKGCWIDTL